MQRDSLPGIISVSALSGRPSRSADAARLAQIRRDLALSVRERMLRALDGLAEPEAPTEGSSPDDAGVRDDAGARDEAP